MIDHYVSHEMNGRAGAIRKAKILRDEMKYKVIAIEHKMVPMAGSTSTPYSSTWGKSEPGYYITVDTCGYNMGETPNIPDIIERL